jgi:hypothetical protein
MLTGRTVLRVLASVALGMAVVAVAGWLAFVPFAKEPGYAFVKAWGGKGSGPGQFSDPTGIAVAGEEVFVADARNGRVQVFDLDGNFKRQFGRPGKDLGELGRSTSMTGSRSLGSTARPSAPSARLGTVPGSSTRPAVSPSPRMGTCSLPTSITSASNT